MTNFITIIPARFKSHRLPGKPLADINGKPMVVHVMERAQASGSDRVIVATDHQEIVDVVESAGGEVCLTSPDHQSGTERLVEVINYYNFSHEQIIVNLQGDEPLILPQMIRQVADNLSGTEASMATLAMPITTAKEAFNPNVVKVVTNRYGYALYFSRASIPWKGENFKHHHKQVLMPLLRHIGIYAYNADFIRRYVSWLPSPLEKIELLEQLRVLWYGEQIYVSKVNKTSFLGVDTQEDLDQIRILQQK